MPKNYWRWSQMQRGSSQFWIWYCMQGDYNYAFIIIISISELLVYDYCLVWPPWYNYNSILYVSGLLSAESYMVCFLQSHFLLCFLNALVLYRGNPQIPFHKYLLCYHSICEITILELLPEYCEFVAILLFS